MRRAAKRDLSEPSIVGALEQVGATVYRQLPVDLLVCFRGVWTPMECKTPGGSGVRASQKAQRAFLALHPEVPVVYDPEAAVAALITCWRKTKC